MRRGRPIGSSVRNHLIELLYFMKRAHGYELYKAYRDLFPKITLRLVYYHLKKGVALGEFKVEKVEQEKGDYSWGSTAQKIYYGLDKKANPAIDPKVKEYFEKKRHKRT